MPIYIYGCKVAAGDAGAEFFQKLYQITQSQICANRHPTGNVAKGGTWNLQQIHPCFGATTGGLPLQPPSPPAPLPVSPETLTAYPHTLGLTPKVDFSTGSSPRGIAIGDINGDGNPDLVTANFYSGNASVLLNTTPTGATAPTFATRVNFTTGSSPIAIALGDFNGDDKPDLVTANFGSGNASVLLNTTPTGATTPTFATRVNFTAGSSTRSIAIDDFNGDGKPDLAVANRVSNTVSIFLNTTATGATTPAFAPKVDLTTGSAPQSVTIGDINGDGKPDLATVNEGNNTSSIFLNTTATGATTPAFAPKVDLTTGSAPQSVTIGDINDDGTPDLAVANYYSNNASVLLNTTATGATTPAFAPKVDFPTGPNPFGISIGDISGDGKLDLATVNFTSATASVLLNTTATGATTPTFATNADFTIGSGPQFLTIGDINGDGKLDLATANRSSNTTSVLLNAAAKVTAVSATTADGSYGVGSTIAITITFDASVTVTGTPQLQLETGTIATYASGSGTDTLTFNYVIQAGDNSADLEYLSTSSLTLNGGTIQDGLGVQADLTLPTLATASSLGGSKAIFVDAVVPTVTIEQAAGQTDPAATGPINFTVTFSKPVTGFAAADISFTGSTAGGTLTPTISGSGTTYNVAVSGMTTGGTVVPSVIANAATDNTSNPSVASTSTDNSVTYNSFPTLTNISKTGNEDSNMTFAATDFTNAFNDTDSLNKIQITSLPANGTLQLSGGNVTLNQEITAANIPNLIFIPNANFNGSSSFTWNGSDGSNYATTNATANLIVAAVNDPPSFSNAGNQTLANWINTTQTINSWANTFVFGPTNENTQTVADFLVSVTSGNTLFTTLPDIANDGTLTYTPNGSPGTATISVQLQDNGGVVNSGIDTSAAATFTITIPPPTVNLSVSTTTATEAGTTAITLTATASGPVVGNQTLNLALSGTASNSDFSNTIPTQITIADGSSTGSVTLTVANDLIDEDNETATFTISNPSAGIQLGTTPSQSVTITDDDTALVSLSTGSTIAYEGGARGSYTIVLNSQPTSPVTLNFSGGSHINPMSGITFDSSNWNIPQSVTVIVIEDAIGQGIFAEVISHTITSNDAKYNGVNVGTVTVSITDDDSPGVAVIQPRGRMDVMENGGEDVFDLFLTTQPTANVNISIITDGQTTANVDYVTFTPDDWNIPQLVRVSAVDDNVGQGFSPSNIRFVATSLDGFYQNLPISGITVNVADNNNVGLVQTMPVPDMLMLGDADDRIVGSDGGDIVNTGGGNNYLDGADGDDVLCGGGSADCITGGDGYDQVLGGGGEDYLDGGDGEDVILGETGSDRLYGGTGNDKLFGESGNDYLFGGAGVDTLTGGTGRDAFAVGNGSGGMTVEIADVITDFVPGEDVIDLVSPLVYDGVAISDGTGLYAGDALVQNALTGEFLARLPGVEAAGLSQVDFV